METPVQKWYTGRSVFVTGGTGFMGKVLLEKMLRTLPSMNKLYILLRPKRGVSPKERLEKIYELPVSMTKKKRTFITLIKLFALAKNCKIINEQSCNFFIGYGREHK